MSKSSLDRDPQDKVPLWPLPYAERQLVVVNDDTIQQAEYLLRQLGATGKKGGTIVDRNKADEKADKVILQMIYQVAAAAAVPAAVNWAFTSTLMGVGVARIGYAYGVSLNKKEAKRLASQFLKAAGLWFISVYVSSKIFAALFETSGIGYVAGAALDIVTSSAIAYAIGATAKAYFQGVHVDSELGEIMRTAFKKARKELGKDTLKKMRKERKLTLFSHEKLYTILSSERGSDIVRRVLLLDPDLANKLSLYMSQRELKQLQDLSIEDIKMLDDEAGLAHEIWELVSDETDLVALLKTIKAQDVLPETREDPIRLWFQDTSILIISHSEAKNLKFSLGHPRNAVLYVGHPSAANIYYPAAQFHRFMFEHKFCEAIRILRFLGAIRIDVENVKGKSTEWSSKLDMSEIAGKLGGEVSGISQSGSRIILRASFPGTTNPYLPEDLVWYLNEPTWQEIAEGRLKHGLQNFELYVQYVDDFGINFGLTGKFVTSSAGLDLGGKFEEHELTVWRLVGVFG